MQGVEENKYELSFVSLVTILRFYVSPEVETRTKYLHEWKRKNAFIEKISNLTESLVQQITRIDLLFSKVFFIKLLCVNSKIPFFFDFK